MFVKTSFPAILSGIGRHFNARPHFNVYFSSVTDTGGVRVEPFSSGVPSFVVQEEFDR